MRYHDVIPVYLLMHYLPAASAIAPGFTAKVTPAGFRFLGRYSHKLVSDYLDSGEQYGNMEGSLDGFKMRINRAKIVGYNGKRFQSIVRGEPGFGLSWKIRNLDFTVDARYWTTYKGVEGRGDVAIKAHRNNFVILLAALMDEHGHLSVQLEDCQYFVATVALTFADTVTDRVLSAFESQLERLVKNSLQQQMCDAISKRLVPSLQKHILKIPTSEHLFDAFHLDYGLIDRPIFLRDSAETLHNGAVYALSQVGPDDFRPQKRLPFAPAPFSPPKGMVETKMAYIYASNYTLASLFYWMNELRMFDYEFTQRSANMDLRSVLLTECDGVCAGAIYPELAEKYPKSAVEIYVLTNAPPTVTLMDGKINLTSPADVQAYIVPLDDSGKRTPLATGKMVNFGRLEDLKLSGSVLHGSVKYSGYALSDLESNEEAINAKNIDFTVQTLVEMVVSPDFRKKFQKGIELPALLDFDLVEPSVVVKEEAIIISTNVCSKLLDKTCGESSDSEEEEDDGDYDTGDIFNQLAGG